MICRETIMETDDPSLVLSAVESALPPSRGVSVLRSVIRLSIFLPRIDLGPSRGGLSMPGLRVVTQP